MDRVARVVDLQATVLHDAQAGRAGAGSGLVVAHAKLEPNGPCAYGHGLVNHGADFLAAAKTVDQFDAVVRCGPPTLLPARRPA